MRGCAYVRYGRLRGGIDPAWRDSYSHIATALWRGCVAQLVSHIAATVWVTVGVGVVRHAAWWDIYSAWGDS